MVKSPGAAEGSFVGLLVHQLFSYEWTKTGGERRLSLTRLNTKDTYSVVFGRYDHERSVPMLLNHPSIRVLFSSGPVWNNHNQHIGYDPDPSLWLVIFELKEDGKVS